MANFIEIHDFNDEGILLLETLAERLRKRAKAKRTRRRKSCGTGMSEDVLTATAGGWKDTVDCEELKRRIYEDRLVSGKNETILLSFLSKFPVMGVDRDICQCFGRERGKLRKAGKMIGDFDLPIAAACLCHNLTLLKCQLF